MRLLQRCPLVEFIKPNHMKVTRSDLILDSKTFSREYEVPRSGGLHLMGIVDRIVRAGQPQSYDDWPEQQLEGLRTPGFIWERVMSQHAYDVRKQRIIEPGEMFWCYQCDAPFVNGLQHSAAYKHVGIYSTVDYIVTEQEKKPCCIVGEWKYSWKSSNRTGPEHCDGIPSWTLQLMWHAMVFDTLQAQTQVLFCRGDYSPGPPRVDAYLFEYEFTPKDIEKNKIRIISNSRAEGLL